MGLACCRVLLIRYLPLHLRESIACSICRSTSQPLQASSVSCTGGIATHTAESPSCGQPEHLAAVHQPDCFAKAPAPRGARKIAPTSGSLPGASPSSWSARRSPHQGPSSPETRPRSPKSSTWGRVACTKGQLTRRVHHASEPLHAAAPAGWPPVNWLSQGPHGPHCPPDVRHRWLDVLSHRLAVSQGGLLLEVAHPDAGRAHDPAFGGILNACWVRCTGITQCASVSAWD